MYKEDEVKAQLAGLTRKLAQYTNLKALASHPTSQLDEVVRSIEYEITQANRRLAYLKEASK